jgi:hypothetical protein
VVDDSVDRRRGALKIRSSLNTRLLVTGGSARRSFVRCNTNDPMSRIFTYYDPTWHYVGLFASSI